jgi:hypothetical protein
MEANTSLAAKLASNPEAAVRVLLQISSATIFALARIESRHTLRHLLGHDHEMSAEQAVAQTIEGVEHLLRPYERAYGVELWATIWEEVKSELTEGLSAVALALRAEALGRGAN